MELVVNKGSGMGARVEWRCRARVHRVGRELMVVVVNKGSGIGRVHCVQESTGGEGVEKLGAAVKERIECEGRVVVGS